MTAIHDKTADQLLAPAVRVHIGGVEEVDPLIERGIDDFPGVSLIDAAAEIIAPHSNDRSLK
jgi:hypothetical protein